jgi:drug/metabolite transporter (DMT)-like permease
MLALLALFAAGVVTALRSRRRSGDPRTRSLAQALGASVAAGMASFALFDALSFPQVACLVMLVIGLVGALHRMQMAGEVSAGTDSAGVTRRSAVRQQGGQRRP